jgi:4-hydroxybenzoate octaprenyltransferase (EC 2.5.1.-)
MLLLWPTLGALWLASGRVPELGLVLIFTVGTIVTRSAGCAVNDWADRDFDAQVERTRNRPLARQSLQPWEAIALFIVLMLLALGLVAFLNRLTVMLAIPGVLLAASYPFFKRFTQLPQAYLGVAFSWGIPMGFAAVKGFVPVGSDAAAHGGEPVLGRGLRHPVCDGGS